MATIDVTVRVSKELSELGDGVSRFLKVLKEEAADGFDVTDLSDIVASAISDLLPAMDGVTELAAELESDQEAFVNAVGITGTKVINALL
jgi:hypothetical protein